MRLTGGWLIALVALSTPAAAEKPQLFAPKRIVLGWMKKATFSVTTLPGVGAPHVSTNVGRVTALSVKGQALQFQVELPTRRSPQELVLLLYRDRGPVFAYHVPLQGRTRLPIRTRPLSTVYLRYGKLEVVKRMGGSSRRYLRLAVPPGIEEIEVEVVDKAGLKSKRRIRVTRPSYPRLALAVQPEKNSATHPTFRVTAVVAEADKDKEQFELEVLGPQPDTRRALAPRATGPGRWTAELSPTEKGALIVRGTLSAEGATSEVKVMARYVPAAEMRRPAGKPPLPTIARAPVKPPPRQTSQVGVELAIAAGLLHNMGDFLSPQFSAALGVTYPLGGAGSLGLRLGASLAWKTQSLDAPPGAPSGLGAASARTLLGPLFIGPIYRGPRWALIPYATANFVVQFAHTKNSASYTEERATLDVVPGFLAQLGAERRVGPVFLFAQAGFLYSRVESDEVELLAGGVSVEAGVRFSLR